jgi:nicotinamidase-related amidase
MRSLAAHRELSWFLLAIALLPWYQSPLALPAETKENAADQNIRIHLRTRVEPFKGSGSWDEITIVRDFPVRETAIIICDMWDKHWCPSARKRCGALAQKMAGVITATQAKGIPVIHAPSECMDFYKETPQRQKMLQVPRVEPPKPLTMSDPPLPIDDSDGGCDDDPPVKSYKAWTRQHPAIPIAENDVISDDGAEVYSFLRQHRIKNLIIMGVHTNMCVLGRTFAIRQMTRWGIRCMLVRDLTDAMYNPKKAPFVSHDEGTELVIKHIEKYWCPSIFSGDLRQGDLPNH